MDLTAIDVSIHRLFALVAAGVAAATEAFLAEDRQVASALIAADRLIDDLQHGVERLVDDQVSSATLASHDVRTLLAVVRIADELERSGDLVEHIALRTGHGITHMVSPRARGLIGEMGRIGCEMWQVAGSAYAERDPRAAGRLRSVDDELDDLHVRLTANLALESLPTAVAIELGLIGRFFERLGDHAVNVTRRFESLTPRPAAVAP